MNKAIMFVAAFSAATSVYQLSAAPQEVSADVRTARLAKRAAKIAADGGWVLKPFVGNCARVVSAQRKVPLATVQGIVDQFNTGLIMNIEVTETEPYADVWATLEKAKKLPRTGVVMLIVDDAKTPRILAAMEDGWSILNVHDLDSDLPPKDVYDNRVRKEINRAFAQAFGAGLSFNRPCAMEPAITLADIDAIKFPVISPEAMSKMSEIGKMRKIDRRIRTTYRIACRDGWAPAPTNDVQKKIWEEVRKLPSDPIKIKFDPKRDK